jgi:hypothetical protein
LRLCRRKWEDNSPPSKAEKNTDGGIAICLSACVVDQMAADTSVRIFRSSKSIYISGADTSQFISSLPKMQAFTGDEMAGAMTYALIETVQRSSRLTYGRLLHAYNQ